MSKNLGIVTYFPKFSSEANPLHELLKKDFEWSWLEQQEVAVKRIKNLIVSPPLLQYFVVKKPVTLTTDPSKGGLGAAYLQKEQLVAYAITYAERKTMHR